MGPIDQNSGRPNFIGIFPENDPTDPVLSRMTDPVAGQQLAGAFKYPTAVATVEMLFNIRRRPSDCGDAARFIARRFSNARVGLCGGRGCVDRQGDDEHALKLEEMAGCEVLQDKVERINQTHLA